MRLQAEAATDQMMAKCDDLDVPWQVFYDTLQGVIASGEARGVSPDLLYAVVFKRLRGE